MEDLGPYTKDTRAGGCGCADIGTFRSGHCTGHTALCRRYMGVETPHLEGPGGFPLQGGTEDFGEETVSTRQWDMGIYLIEEAMREAGLE